ncbi:MAG TPA: PEP/pyruvate-binding domain-containing protein, partial [Anaerolineales bacterium]
MTLPYSSIDPTYRIYLALAQYPILQRRIRGMMRKELFARGILSADSFENDVRQQAIDSQGREGLQDPYGEEPHEEWTGRMDTVRSHLTDLHFAENLPYELFEELVRKALVAQGAESDEMLRAFNPELAPQEALFEQVKAISRLSPQERVKYEAREREIKVVLIRSTISDQLAYINIAKNWFSLDDLMAIRRHKIGKGRIGGKAAGMLLALRILQGVAEDDIVDNVTIPESYYLGADVMYAFMTHSGLMHWADQKYKEEEEIRSEYPRILEDYINGEFPPDVLEELSLLLEKVKGYPIIVRSSSLLEDNFGFSFAGKYESYFCANQGTPEENLEELTHAIAKVYASGLNPDALLYRRAHGLQDYDERLAVLIQVVQGEKLGDYYLPHLAGVAFSRNLFRWSPKIRQEDGFLRLVWGLGTRAVDHLGNDYPRLVALSHPELRAQADSRSLRVYSQHMVDLIDLKANKDKTLPVGEVLKSSYPYLRLLASVYKDESFYPLRSKLIPKGGELVLTLDGALRDTPLVDRIRRILSYLQESYGLPVDMEFTVQFRREKGKTEMKLFILQCRPQSHLQDQSVVLPEQLAQEQVVFSTSKVAPHGKVDNIRYVVFVPQDEY